MPVLIYIACPWSTRSLYLLESIQSGEHMGLMLGKPRKAVPQFSWSNVIFVSMESLMSPAQILAL